MRQTILAAAAATVSLGLATSAFANGDAAQCFDKANLRYFDCPTGVDWSGAYLGGHLGYAWADVEGSFGALDYDDLDVEGFLAGGQVGYQEQFDSGLVLGLELDFSGVWADDSAAAGTTIVLGNTTVAAPYSIEAELNWLASARLRLGLAQGEVMPYLTGGVALGGFEASAVTPTASVDVDETVFGGVVGGGVEIMADSNWIVGLEGLYYFFEEDQSLSPPGLAGDKVEFGDVIVARARLSYKF